MDGITHSERRSLPQDIALSGTQPFLEPSVDPALARFQRDDRVLARMTSPHALLCLPLSAYPSVEDGVPLFTKISTFQGVETLEEIEACLDAVEAHLDPLTGPTGCHYCVRTQSVQSTSNTPSRFLEDLRTLPALAEEIEAATSTAYGGGYLDSTIGSCLWPTEEGWFYLEVDKSGERDTFSLSYGLLRFGSPLDPTAIASFFEATAETPPNTFGLWPIKELVLSGSFKPPIDRLEPIGDAYQRDPESPSPEPWFAGENPLFGVSPAETGLTERISRDIYQPLECVSTLLYDSPTLNRSTENCHLERILAMDAPTQRTVFVSAAVYAPGNDSDGC